jgi:hypothetical protein
MLLPLGEVPPYQAFIDKFVNETKRFAESAVENIARRAFLSLSLRPFVSFNHYLVEVVVIVSKKAVGVTAAYFCKKFGLKNTRFSKAINTLDPCVKFSSLATFLFFKYLPFNSVVFVNIIREDSHHLIDIFSKNSSVVERVLGIAEILKGIPKSIGNQSE